MTTLPVGVPDDEASLIVTGNATPAFWLVTPLMAIVVLCSALVTTSEADELLKFWSPA
jgi:hypothetical protein